MKREAESDSLMSLLLLFGSAILVVAAYTPLVLPLACLPVTIPLAAVWHAADLYAGAVIPCAATMGFQAALRWARRTTRAVESLNWPALTRELPLEDAVRAHIKAVRYQAADCADSEARIRQLLLEGHDPSGAGPGGRPTPLMLAVAAPCPIPAVVILLLSHGREPPPRSRRDASCTRHPRASWRPPVHVEDADGRTALFHATAPWAISLVRGAGGCVHHNDHSYFTPLEHAAHRGRSSAVRALAPYSPWEYCQEALVLAVAAGDMESARTLISRRPRHLPRRSMRHALARGVSHLIVTMLLSTLAVCIVGDVALGWRLDARVAGSWLLLTATAAPLLLDGSRFKVDGRVIPWSAGCKATPKWLPGTRRRKLSWSWCLKVWWLFFVAYFLTAPLEFSVHSGLYGEVEAASGDGSAGALTCHFLPRDIIERVSGAQVAQWVESAARLTLKQLGGDWLHPALALLIAADLVGSPVWRYAQLLVWVIGMRSMEVLVFLSLLVGRWGEDRILRGPAMAEQIEDAAASFNSWVSSRDRSHAAKTSWLVWFRDDDFRGTKDMSFHVVAADHGSFLNKLYLRSDGMFQSSASELPHHCTSMGNAQSEWLYQLARQLFPPEAQEFNATSIPQMAAILGLAYSMILGCRLFVHSICGVAATGQLVHTMVHWHAGAAEAPRASAVYACIAKFTVKQTREETAKPAEQPRCVVCWEQQKNTDFFQVYS
eukprot:gene5840-7038_t